MIGPEFIIFSQFFLYKPSFDYRALISRTFKSYYDDASVSIPFAYPAMTIVKSNAGTQRGRVARGYLLFLWSWQLD